MPTPAKPFLIAAILLHAAAAPTLASAAAPATGQQSAGAHPARPQMQENRPGSGPGFSALDTDGDRRISPDEARAAPQLTRHFAAADRNNDGVIDRAEFSAFASELRAYRSQRPTQGRSTAGERPGFKPDKTPRSGLLRPGAAVQPGTDAGQ